MKLSRWSLVGLVLAVAGCGGNTDNSTAIDPGTVGEVDGGGSDNGGGNDGSGSTGGTNGSTNGSGTTAGTTGGTTGPDNCEEHVVRNEQVTPDIMIVLDRSGSMNPTSNEDNTDRWTGSKNAIIASTKSYNDKISFGLMAFPDDGQCGAQQVAVQIKAKAAAEIETALNAMKADGSTPTPAAMKRAHEVVGKSVMVDGMMKPRVVLLVTDGAPTCGGSATGALPPECTGGLGAFFSQACQDALAAAAGDATLVKAVVDEITQMTSEGTRTFVIGFQTAGTTFAGNLDQMAAAGGTKFKTHNSVASEQELSAVLDTLIGSAVSCTFALDEAPANPANVLVKVDNMQLNLGQPDGWKLGADGKTIEVQGKACELLQASNAQHILSVEVKCDAVPII